VSEFGFDRIENLRYMQCTQERGDLHVTRRSGYEIITIQIQW